MNRRSISDKIYHVNAANTTHSVRNKKRASIRTDLILALKDDGYTTAEVARMLKLTRNDVTAVLAENWLGRL